MLSLLTVEPKNKWNIKTLLKPSLLYLMSFYRLKIYLLNDMKQFLKKQHWRNLDFIIQFISLFFQTIGEY